ncbi:hydrogenase formation protein HypD [Pseudomonadota bacterium]
MKYVDEYRDAASVHGLLEKIKQITTKSHVIMEVCGGQTHAIVKHGLDQLLPTEIELIHGPGCPVCVTPIEIINQALALASLPEVIFCSFGDMLRVPGTNQDLLSIKAAGGDVRIVYSPLDAVTIAENNPEKQIVFLAVGFETTAPANAMAVRVAERKAIDNFSLLVSHVLVPPALIAILESPNNRIDGFLAAGHVCTIMGLEQYYPISTRYRVPIIATGFEPVDILQGILMCVSQLESNRHEVENQYSRAVKSKGNQQAQEIINSVFEITPREWRGIGTIDKSGWSLTAQYAHYDALQRFDIRIEESAASNICISGDILQGHKKPGQCPAFAKECRPDKPLGAPMVSNEGACNAYYRYRGQTETSVV